MNRFITAAIGAIAMAGICVSAQAQDADEIDFGDNSSEWAFDGECDDPRFDGDGTFFLNIEADRMHDADDCRAAYLAGEIWLKDTGQSQQADGRPGDMTSIDFGTDSGMWANDGECDDPRFTGIGMAETLVDDDIMADATDCRSAYAAGDIVLRGQPDSDMASADGIDFGNDSSMWARDGECDDPRFEGSAMAEILDEDDLRRDASDCRSAYLAGQIRLRDTAATQISGDVVFGDDASEWAFDDECDDPRFEGPGMTDTPLLDGDRFHDATDCRMAWEAGRLSLRLRPESYDSLTYNGIDFGDDNGNWTHDGECDDPRFEGPGTAEELVEADRMHDATDCLEAYKAGRIRMITPAGPTSVTGLDFGDDSGVFAQDGECDDPRFAGEGMTDNPMGFSRLRDASDCRAAFQAGSVRLAADVQPTQVAAKAAPVALGSAGRGGPDFGDDSSSFANDGQCDDPRFTGKGMAPVTLEESAFTDATDCRALFESGQIREIG